LPARGALTVDSSSLQNGLTSLSRLAQTLVSRQRWLEKHERRDLFDRWYEPDLKEG
jgi:hypothetical protein